jgi:myo-inositol-1(or 4)-monophosphatase
MSTLLDTGIDAARAAGALLRGKSFVVSSIREKDDRSFATDLDMQAEAAIRSIIQSRFPSHGILGEEGGQSGAGAEYTWIIDPLDGTHNYIRKIPLYGVSIGIMRGHEFVAGVLYIPENDRMYSAEAGGGAFCNGKRINVAQEPSIERCTLAYDSCIRADPERKLRALDACARNVFNVRMFGSSVINLSGIAEGSIDIVVEFDDEPWDFAAGVCIVREAGGKVSDLTGAPLVYGVRGYVASNSAVHEQACRCVAGALREHAEAAGRKTAP